MTANPKRAALVLAAGCTVSACGGRTPAGDLGLVDHAADGGAGPGGAYASGGTSAAGGVRATGGRGGIGRGAGGRNVGSGGGDGVGGAVGGTTGSGGGSGGAGAIGGDGGGSSGGAGGVTSPCGGDVTIILRLIGDTGIVFDKIGGVASWFDAVGSRYATQTSVDARPSATTQSPNGRKVLHFDGIDDHLSLPSGFSDFTSGLTAFVVVRPEATTPIGAPRFFDFSIGYGTLADSILFVRFGEGGNELFYQTYLGDSPGPYASGVNRVTDDLWQVFSVVAQCGPAESLRSATVFRNGIAVGTTDVYVPRVIERSSNFIARSNLPVDTYLKGSIAEIRLYRGAMSDAARMDVESVLEADWGVLP